MADPTYSPISYTGPKQTYRAGSTSNTKNEATDKIYTEVGSGFHDLGYVEELFRIMDEQIAAFVSDLETDLRRYSLIVLPDDTVLKAAYDMVFSDLDSDTLSGYVHYNMYKTLLSDTTSNAANYIRNRYESTLRKESGVNSLDVLKMILYINAEMTRMKEFIDGFIGELDDTSEYRVIESFQNWGEDAYDTIAKLRQTFKKEKTARLPASELDQIDNSKAIGVQALFKIKLNVQNARIKTTFAELDREFLTTADKYYNEYLGPALKFRIDVGRNLGTGIKTPLLRKEVDNTVASLDANFAVQLADLMKRVSNFRRTCIEQLGDIAMRDSLVVYMNQLGAIGKPIKPAFSNISVKDEELIQFGNVNLLKEFRRLPIYEDNFTHDHNELSNRDSDDAHPQYLLRAGGVLTGDVTLEEGVRIDGIIPSRHKHNGLDGSAKIAGGDIEYNSITDGNVSTDPSPTGIPYNLAVVSQVPLITPTGTASITVQVSFDMDDENASGYEFEITELS